MSRRSIARHREWKVPRVIASAAAGPSTPVSLSRSSRAALLVKVSARTRRGGTCSAPTRCAMCATRTRVLPVPGPAESRTGPRVASTAANCCWFIPRSSCSGESSCDDDDDDDDDDDGRRIAAASDTVDDSPRPSRAPPCASLAPSAAKRSSSSATVVGCGMDAAPPSLAAPSTASASPSAVGCCCGGGSLRVARIAWRWSRVF